MKILNIFNFWKLYPKHKPEKSGWYICSIRYGHVKSQAYVMDLWYDLDKDTWFDNRRRDVYSTYKVYGHSDITNKFDKRIYSDHLCIREDVYAWKRMPKLCKRYPRDNFGYISDKLDGQEAFNILKTHFLGSDYYVTESICDNEVNAILVKEILSKYKGKEF